MNRINLPITRLLIAVFAVLGLVAAPIQPVSAAPSPADSITKGINAAGAKSDTATLGDKIKLVINVLLFIIGAVAVIMIILGGLRYTTSNGDSNQVTAAKNTIMYAVIGLVVALLAFAIVNFVVKQFTK